MTPPAAAAAPAVHPRRTVAPGRSRTAPSRPRRVSGPARPGTSARPVRRPAQAGGGIALGLLGALDGLSQHRLIDRLVRGRTAIVLVAFALIGIVTLQLGLLRLNSGIGHTLEREALLQRQNAALSIENSELAAGDRVESRAAQLGMELVPVGALHFLGTGPRIDFGRAVGALRTPVQASSGTSREASPSSGTATGEGSPPAATEQASTATSASTSESSSATAGESKQPSGESSSPPASPTSPAGTQPSATTPQAEAAPSSSAEATPAGGTQASPAG
jgi:hypothetical protein